MTGMEIATSSWLVCVEYGTLAFNRVRIARVSREISLTVIARVRRRSEIGEEMISRLRPLFIRKCFGTYSRYKFEYTIALFDSRFAFIYNMPFYANDVIKVIRKSYCPHLLNIPSLPTQFCRVLIQISI